jgi:hypothetical protein
MIFTMNPPRPKFELARVSGAPVSDEELLTDLRLVASKLDRSTVPQKTYGELGKYDYSTVIRHFGSWNAALLAAGLDLSNEIQISDARLFENLLALWQHFGRQPRRRELSHPPSIISQSPYLRRFGSWSVALERFVAYANSPEAESETVTSSSATGAKRTSRDASLRLRWKVLHRDRFTCQHCGASPAKTVGVDLHVDHIVPWSRGGETTMENLQTLSSRCNLGKGNLDPRHGTFVK